MCWSGRSLRDEVGRFNAELDAHHWLGHRLTGQVMRYVAVLDGQWVALVGFGSAALTCAARDRFVGWSREQQYARLRHVANNQRFCVLPEARRPNLASAVLARVLRRVSADYLAVYGHRVVAVETFTDPSRHTGACYAAANFRQVGDTLGFSRSAGSYHHHGRRKRVWLYLLRRDAARDVVRDVPASAVDQDGAGGRFEHAGAGRGRRAAGCTGEADRPTRQAWCPPPGRSDPDDDRRGDAGRLPQLLVGRGLRR